MTKDQIRDHGDTDGILDFASKALATYHQELAHRESRGLEFWTSRPMVINVTNILEISSPSCPASPSSISAVNSCLTYVMRNKWKTVLGLRRPVPMLPRLTLKFLHRASKLGAIIYKGLEGDRLIGTTDPCNLAEEGGTSIEVSEGDVQMSSWAEFLNQSPEQDQDSQPSEQVEVDPRFVVCKRWSESFLVPEADD
ncbi:hypothetical protein L873DRAFT_1793361 [Choiromyces venosus 120613-1]|uniref:Uncharacterized protein n=1 Tax=Choiromyces venosus 120613-1 TaxID=1336337 RepID=A0A3N4J9G3_9PEZI|nr:hypothetical protein L873DRAFT_1793361 [Choiromyces venosus 120613-1]